MKSATVTLLALVFFARASGAQEEWKMDEPRPLDKFAGRLLKQYGYLVTYEEAPYDERELRTDVYTNGKRYRYPSWRPMTFGVHPRNHATMSQPNAEVKPSAPEAEEIVSRLVREYNESGNPGRFSVVVNGDYIHIIQTERSVKGKLEPFEPVLNAKITMSPETRLCNDVMKEFLSQLALVRGVHVVEGMVPPNAMLRQQCAISATDVTAREVLLQMLHQMGDYGPERPPLRYVYELAHDANGDLYFLSTWHAPWMMPPAPSESAPKPEIPEQRSAEKPSKFGVAPKPKAK